MMSFARHSNVHSSNVENNGFDCVDVSNVRLDNGIQKITHQCRTQTLSFILGNENNVSVTIFNI